MKAIISSKALYLALIQIYRPTKIIIENDKFTVCNSGSCESVDCETKGERVELNFKWKTLRRFKKLVKEIQLQPVALSVLNGVIILDAVIDFHSKT